MRTISDAINFVHQMQVEHDEAGVAPGCFDYEAGYAQALIDVVEWLYDLMNLTEAESCEEEQK